MFPHISRGFTGGFEEKQAGAVTATNTTRGFAEALAKNPAISNASKSGFHGALEALPILMKGLDEVAKIHPFAHGMIY
jgi:hypothetical protein